MALSLGHRKDSGRLARGVIAEVAPGAAENVEIVHFRVTVPRTQTTPLVIVPAAQVPSGATLRITSLALLNTGGTAWSAGQNVLLEGTDGVDHVSIPTGGITANVVLVPTTGSTAVALLAPYFNGGTLSQGLQVLVSGAVAAGTDVVIVGTAVIQ